MNRLPKWVRSVAVMAAVILSAVLSHYATLASQPKPQSALDILGAHSGRPAYVYLESRYNEPFSIYFPHFIDGAEAAEFARQHGENIVLSNGESVGADVFWDRLHVL